MQAELLESVGRYEIVGDLGAGSMSRVYLAHDPNLDRKVALKVVLQSISLDNREQNELESRFLLEARAAGKLSHPGIVRVYDADSDPELGIPYIAMEWVQGRSLRQLLDDAGRLTGPRTLEILEQVARALDYAHRAGRIHRDIKPSNILICTDGTAKVSDFGVAKIVSESHTISGQVLGTPAYMSPEQVRDDPLDGRSDLFSLGAVLYQCVSGSTPFGGDSLVQVVYKILNVDPRPLQLAASPAMNQLASVVERSLQKDTNSRFQTGSEFAEALRQVRLAMETDPGTDFRTGRSESDVRPSSSDTIAILAAQTAQEPGAHQTRTVQLSTASIHRAARPGGAQGPLDTVATAPAAPAPEARHRRLRIAALLLLLVSVLGVSAVFRFENDIAEPPLIAKTRPTAGSADTILDELMSKAIPPEPSIDSPPSDKKQEPEVQPSPATVPERNPPRPAPASQTREPVRLPVAQAEPDPAPPVILTPLTILYKHKGGPAFLSIILDGTRVWSQELKPVEGRLQKLTGYGNRAVIPVPPGTHTLEVNLSDPDRGIDATRAIRSRYTNGKKRTLRVSVDPKANTLQLRWKE